MKAQLLTDKLARRRIQGAVKLVRISGGPLIASLTAAAKRDRRTLANFVLRLIEKTQPLWQAEDWDKNHNVPPRPTERRIQGEGETLSILVSPQMRRHLLAYERHAGLTPKGNLAGVAGCAIEMAMLHRGFIEEASKCFGRYAYDEGFAPGQQKQLLESMLKAR